MRPVLLLSALCHALRDQPGESSTVVLSRRARSHRSSGGGLAATVAWAEEQDLRWAFTLSNAGARYFEDRSDLGQLDEIDWHAVEATDWRLRKEGKSRVPGRAPLPVGTRSPHRCPVAAGLPPDRGDPGSPRTGAPSKSVERGTTEGEWCRDHVQDWRHPHRGYGSLGHTVNCVGVMGRGVALQFKRAFPDNFKAYAARCKRNEMKPGRVFVFETGAMVPPRYIINFPTKRHWRGKSRLEDIESGLESLAGRSARAGSGRSPSHRSAAGWAGCTGRVCVGVWRRLWADSTASRSSSSSQAELRRTVE